LVKIIFKVLIGVTRVKVEEKAAPLIYGTIFVRFEFNSYSALSVEKTCCFFRGCKDAL
jgi:trimethylamine:corrinoid methyltransferase-like protein